MKVVRESISLVELATMAEKMYGKLVKAVVDIEKEIMVVDADLHADQELFMLDEEGSEQAHLWGINIHPSKVGTQEWIEFDSMINLRPSWGNYTRSVEDPKIQARIREIVSQLVKQ